MSFKIVQKLNKNTLLIVPEGFEKNCTLWYPPCSWSSKTRENMLKNKFALPDKSTWPATPCIVKRRRISTYEQAQEQEEQLMQNPNANKGETIPFKSEESSDEECSAKQKSQPPKASKEISKPIESKSDENQSEKSNQNKPPLVQLNSTADFDNALWECFDSTKSLSELRCKIQALQNQKQSAPGADVTMVVKDNPIITNIHALPRQNNEPKSLKPEKDFFIDCDSESDSLECQIIDKSNLSSPSEEILSKILKNQEDYHNEISQKLKELKTYLKDGLAKVFTELETLTQILYSNSLSSVNPDIYPKKFCIENFKKVSTCEEANRLEKMLMISEFKADMVEKMSNIVGNNGTQIGNGKQCCYDLIEVIFQRKFLKICSWSGASTSKMEEGKIAFLKYKNIISFFASVILNADPEFPFGKTKEFFKKVLKNSSKFLHPKDSNHERNSSKKKITEEGNQNKSKEPIKRRQSQGESCETEKVLRNCRVKLEDLLAVKRSNNNVVANGIMEPELNDIENEEEEDEPSETVQN